MVAADHAVNPPAPPEAAPPCRTYARWAARERLEDYSLRFAPTTFRTWSALIVASTALGGIAYLADYAIGASVVLTDGGASGGLLAVWILDEVGKAAAVQPIQQFTHGLGLVLPQRLAGAHGRGSSPTSWPTSRCCGSAPRGSSPGAPTCAL